MIKYNKVKRGGKAMTWVCVVEGYRPGPGLPPKQRTVKGFGYLEDQPDQEAFMAEVREFNATYREKAEPRIEVPSNALMYSEGNRRQNYGYRFLEAVYDRLGIGDYLEGAGKSRRGLGAGGIFRFLVLARALSPCSKRASSQRRGMFYGMSPEFTLPEAYRALDRIASLEQGLQRHLNEAVKGFIGRGMGQVVYDVTNCWFEIDFPDEAGGLRQKGVSKERRTDPIAGFGLLTDGNGLPVGMSVFPGNTAECLTLGPAMRDVKESYGLGRLVVVADKGLNSSGNIDMIVNGGDGYVISQPLRGPKGKRYLEAMLDRDGYIESPDGSCRSKLFEEEHEGLGPSGLKTKRKRKVLICWSQAEEARARRKRGDKLERAARAISNGTSGIKKGYAEYIKEEAVDRATGERLG
jgi:hypothetical protein